MSEDRTPPSAERPSSGESSSGATLTSPGRASPKGDPPARLDPSRLPEVDASRYVIHGEFAHGGLGRILQARDLKLDRPVALKELLHTAPTSEARFVSEALVTARLQHPSIVPIYDAGRWPSGKPFLSMKLVSGRSLADVITASRTLDDRLALLPHVLAVAEAIAYAHSERIIHRDLKPANVLLGAFGETVVIDWGLAKDLARSEPTAPPGQAGGGEAPEADDGLTLAGEVIGTPAYMPPEQAQGQPVDERADVYALGAILYHLLAGTRPYENTSSANVLLKVAHGPPVPLATLQKGIPEELLTIVSKAMARAPSERYPTARELADDLRRFQTGQIVNAHRYTRRELLRRFTRRYRAVLAVAVGALLVLSAVGALSVHRVVAERDRAEHNEALAFERADELTLTQARAAVARDPNEAIAWLRSLSPHFNRWSLVRTIASDARAHGLATLLRGHAAPVGAVLFTADGRRLITGSDDHTVRVWDLETRQSRVLEGHTDEVYHLRLLPNGRVASCSSDGTVRVWDLATGQARILRGHEGTVADVEVLPDGGHLASSGLDGTIRIWDLTTGQARVLRSGGNLHAPLALSPDGRYALAAKLESPQPQLWDLERGELRELTGHEATVIRVAYSPRGDFAASTSADQTVRLWNVRTGEGRVLGERLSALYTLTFSPDGRQLAAAGEDSVVHLWSVDSGAATELRGHEGAVRELAFSRDSTRLASGGMDGTARLWELPSGRSRTFRGEKTSALAFSPDERWLAVGGLGGVVRLFDLEATPSRVLSGPSAPLHRLVLSPDGQRVAALAESGTSRLWNLATGGRLSPDVPGDASSAAFSPDGRWLAVSSKEGPVRLLNRDGHLEHVLEGSSGERALAFAPDGLLLASAGEGGSQLRDIATGRRNTLPGDTRLVEVLAFSPEGRRLASAGQDGSVRLWDIAAGTAHLLGGHKLPTVSLAFSPDGRYLASRSLDQLLLWNLESGASSIIDSGGGIKWDTFSPDGASLFSLNQTLAMVRRWNVRTGQTLAKYADSRSLLVCAALSPDGRRLVAAGGDKVLRVWDVATGEGRALRGHDAAVWDVAFTPDSASIVSLSEDGTVRLWPDDLPWEPTALRAWLQAVDVPPLATDTAR